VNTSFILPLTSLFFEPRFRTFLDLQLQIHNDVCYACVCLSVAVATF
jgi:hypothetical protein